MHTKYKNVNPQYLVSYPYYARSGQDKYLDQNIFKGKTNGVYVDIGAYDGVKSSNTLFFEESRGWTGICVEPLPNAFRNLEKNRKCICVNKCASDCNKTSKFMHVNPSICPPSPREKGRTSNYEKMSGLIDYYSPEHLEIINNIINTYGGSKNILECECVDINKILEILKKPKIDLLSIDTEGSELNILKHINFLKYNINVIVVEVLYSKSEILEYMNNIGYKKIEEVGYDWIFKKD